MLIYNSTALMLCLSSSYTSVFIVSMNKMIDRTGLIGLQKIPYTMQGDQMTRFIGLAFNFCPKLRYMDINGSLVGTVFISPNFF